MDVKFGYFKTGRSSVDNVTVDIGFVPDVLELFQTDGVSGLSGINKYMWYNCLAVAGTSGQYGLVLDGVSAGQSVLGRSTGLSDTMRCIATLNSGISAINEDAGQVLIPSPIAGVGEVPVTAHQLTNSSVIGFHRGDDSRVGHVVRIGLPMSQDHTGLVYEAIGADANSNFDNPSNTTWPTEAGKSVLSSGVTVLARDDKQVKGGRKGFQLGSGMLEGSTQQSEWWFKAIRADKVRDLGDAGVKTDHRV